MRRERGIGRGEKLTHRHAQQTNRQLHAPDDVKRPSDAPVDDPVVSAVGQGEGEEVLEDEEEGEGFEHDVFCGIMSKRRRWLVSCA